MRVRVYAGLGSLRELRWKGELDVLPREGDAIGLPTREEGYRVSTVFFRLDLKPPVVEIYVRGS